MMKWLRRMGIGMKASWCKWTGKESKSFPARNIYEVRMNDGLKNTIFNKN